MGGKRERARGYIYAREERMRGEMRRPRRCGSWGWVLRAPSRVGALAAGWLAVKSVAVRRIGWGRPDEMGLALGTGKWLLTVCVVGCSVARLVASANPSSFFLLGWHGVHGPDSPPRHEDMTHSVHSKLQIRGEKMESTPFFRVRRKVWHICIEGSKLVTRTLRCEH